MSGLELTAQAVAEALCASGRNLALADTDGYRCTGPGFSVASLPMDPPRLSVTWYSEDWSVEEVHSLRAARLGDCADVLDELGYQLEFVADYPMGYLVVWTEDV
jgi:hypothetical protein